MSPPDGGGPIRIYFSPLKAGREPVPLAQACLPGARVHDTLFERRFEGLFREAPSLWRSVPFEEAQLVVHSYLYRDEPEPRELSARARRAGLPALFFDTSDTHDPRTIEHGLIYRSAIYRSAITPCERAMPPICEDILLYRSGRPPPRVKAKLPVVSFCGYLLPAWKVAVQRLMGRAEKARGHRVRRDAMRTLARSRDLRASFLPRKDYWGGAVRYHKDPELVARVREEFVSNMLESDYVLCARGAGNFSYRFYETLSAGRIPLFIDTDCALPLADRIDWERHCVFVDAGADAPRILCQFHDSMDDARFLELQRANRELWERYLNPLSFLRLVVEEAAKARSYKPATTR